MLMKTEGRLETVGSIIRMWPSKEAAMNVFHQDFCVLHLAGEEAAVSITFCLQAATSTMTSDEVYANLPMLSYL